MYTEFHIKANALDINFIKSVKAMFKSKSISIIITEDLDETEYLLSSPANRKMLGGSLKNVKKGKLVEVNIDQYLKK